MRENQYMPIEWKKEMRDWRTWVAVLAAGVGGYAAFVYRDSSKKYFNQVSFLIPGDNPALGSQATAISCNMVSNAFWAFLATKNLLQAENNQYNKLDKALGIWFAMLGSLQAVSLGINENDFLAAGAAFIASSLQNYNGAAMIAHWLRTGHSSSTNVIHIGCNKRYFTVIGLLALNYLALIPGYGLSTAKTIGPFFSDFSSAGKITLAVVAWSAMAVLFGSLAAGVVNNCRLASRKNNATGLRTQLSVFVLITLGTLAAAATMDNWQTAVGLMSFISFFTFCAIPVIELAKNCISTPTHNEATTPLLNNQQRKSSTTSTFKAFTCHRSDSTGKKAVKFISAVSLTGLALFTLYAQFINSATTMGLNQQFFGAEYRHNGSLAPLWWLCIIQPVMANGFSVAKIVAKTIWQPLTRRLATQEHAELMSDNGADLNVPPASQNV